MKLITLNSHSLIEENYEEKFSRFILAMLKEKPDILALQEVNQSTEGPELSQRELEASGYVPPLSSPEALLEPAHPVRRDNHGYRCAAALRSLGFPLYWTWVPAKIGYDRFDEGVALFSSYPIRRAEGFYITGSQDYGNWRSRKALLVSFDTPWGIQYACSLHTGRWDDPQEPFSSQWQRLSDRLLPLRHCPIWLLGDFNAPDSKRGESFDLILSGGWLDACRMAEEAGMERAADRMAEEAEGKHAAASAPAKSCWEATVEDGIDGWEDKGIGRGMRIDYIFTNQPVPISSCQVIFKPDCYGIVSDHRAVMVNADLQL